MLRFRTFTRREAIEWQRANPGATPGGLADLNPDYFHDRALDEIVMVVAFDDDRLVGKNYLSFTTVEVNGERITCVVTGNLFVDPDYRSKGVGTFIKMHVMKLGYPQFSAAVSGMMRRVYDSWSAYSRIDASPIYTVPVNLAGLLWTIRQSYYDRLRERPRAAWRALASVAAMRVRAWLRIRATPGRRVAVVAYPSAEGERALALATAARVAPVRLPWNAALVRAGLRAAGGRFRYALLRVDAPDGAADPGYHLLSVYTKRRTVRLLRGFSRQVIDAHLNEIHPPVDDPALLAEMYAHAHRMARSLKAATLHVHALTPAMRRACSDAHMEQDNVKVVYLASRHVDPKLHALLSVPANWWCRAFTEQQFEEVPPGAELL